MKMKNSLCWTLFLSMLLFFTFISPLYSKTIKCHPDDRKALIQIKAGFGNPYYLSGWDTILFPDCCHWSCVTCDYKPPYRVIYLNIGPTVDISGQIPAAIGDLPELNSVFFDHVPNLTGTIPPSITKLTNLVVLTFTYTNLSGPIPAYLTKLKNLTGLILPFNHFTGSIPPEFSQFDNLQRLDLNWNNLTGIIPESFFTGSITDLHLSHNQLTGKIPKSLLSNSNLTLLDLSHNNLTEGDASYLFGKNNTIKQIDLSRNNLTFDLSKVELSESLVYLDLNHNKIFGSIPQQFTKLQFLNVSYNRLCGQIPEGENLQNLDISSYFHNRCLCGSPLPACT